MPLPEESAVYRPGAEAVALMLRFEPTPSLESLTAGDALMP